MKNLIITITAAFLFIGLASFQNNHIADETMLLPPDGSEITVSNEVKAILDKSCLPCHGTDGSGKAKFKWNYDKMGEYKTSKLVSKMEKLIGEVTEAKMPPKKFFKKHPDAKLADNEKKMLEEWANSIIEKNKE